ncbi:hypothetical protein EV426DRAFT_670986 [Tirmania nivea]|nr:hypothetical protein EV426DRAFT_670986 [Tirmania nivea]
MSKPTDDYSSPPNQPEAPAKSIDLHSTKVLLKFTRSFVLRWLEVISDGIEIFDGLQDVQCKHLEASCKELFANYCVFSEAVKSCPTYPPLETIHKGPIFNVDYQAWIQYLRCPRWPGESARMQIIRDRCSVLLGELEEGRTILEGGGGGAAHGASTDQTLLVELAYKEVDGVWAARAKLKFAHTHDQRFLTPTEELQFYGFSEEDAHKMLLEAEFVEDEDDAYEMALTHVRARQQMKRFETSEQLVEAAREIGMSRRFCSVMGDSAEFQWIASQPLWKLIVENIEDVHLFYMAVLKMSSNQSEDSSDIQDPTQVGSASISQPDISSTQTPENHAGIDEDMNEEEFPLLELAITDRRDAPEQFITLYKGGLSTMKHFLSWTSTTEARNVTEIESLPPSDFCTFPAIYLTPHKELAEYHANLRRRISGLGNDDVGILTIYIRQFEHENLEGDTWKKGPDREGRGSRSECVIYCEPKLAGGEEVKCLGYTVTTAIPLS